MNGRVGHWVRMAVVALAAMGSVLSQNVEACPGCIATGATFCEEMAVMDAVVFARLVAGPKAEAHVTDELAPSQFEVVRVLKGEQLVRVGEKLEALQIGGGKPGDQFLLMGITRPQWLWSTPQAFSTRGIEYLSKLMHLQENSIERYRFVLDYLEDKDADLAGDAYNEFAKAPYGVVRSLKDDLQKDKIIAQIQDPNVSATHRRLYFVMLGIVGDEKDVPLLEEMLRSGDREQRRGLDMIIFSYLSIRGEKGLATIEELFLANEACDYSDTYAAIMALRMHASEKAVLEPKQIVGSLRVVLARPQLADLVIPDLARFEDWSALDMVFELYRSADETSSWVRVPVVNYLRACPLPRAKELIAECEKIDPQAVKRAHAFFPSVLPAPAAQNGAASDTKGGNRTLFVSTAAEAIPAAFQAPVPEPEPAATAQAPIASGGSSAATNVASVNPGAAPARALKSTASTRPNLWLLLGVPILSGAALWILQSSILRGRIGRG